MHSSYLTAILPGLSLTGLGLGLVFSTATNTGTEGVRASDAGVASATVNTAQQVGGSLGLIGRPPRLTGRQPTEIQCDFPLAHRTARVRSCPHSRS